MPPKARPDRKSWFNGWVLKCASLLVLVAAFIGAIIAAAHWGLEHLRGKDRYEVAFNTIECPAPVGMECGEFLDEVRYVARLPKNLHLLDDDLPQRLREGFARHPWVEKVEGVEITPPRHIRVKLTLRTPVLAVPVGAKTLAVNGAGVLLPVNAPTRGLPLYDGDAQPPAGPAGTRWGDPNVEAAAEPQEVNSLFV